MNTTNSLIFNLKRTIFAKDLINYKKKSLSALYKLFNNKSKTLYKSKTNGYLSCADRPYVGNDGYNKIIIALRYDRHPETITEYNKDECKLDKKYHQFLYTLLMLPKNIRDTLEDIVSDFCKVQEPDKWARSDKLPIFLNRRSVEKKLADFIETRLIEVNEYYKTLMVGYDAELVQKEKIKKKSYEIWECECGGYKGLYAHSSRHLKTPLHIKRLEAVLNERENKLTK